MSTNEQAADTEQITQSLVSDDEARDIAQAKYITMPVVRLSTIARLCGRSKEQIATWRDENNWLYQRDVLRRDGKQKLIESVGDPVQANVNILRACKALGEVLAQRSENMDRFTPLDVILTHTQAVHKLFQAQFGAFKALGISTRVGD